MKGFRTAIQFRTPFKRWLLFASVLSSFLAVLILILAGTSATREEGLKLGSTTYTAEFDRDETQDEWIEVSSRQNTTWSRKDICIRLPFGLLTIESTYEPERALRKRLPRDVPSLTKRLNSRNRYEVKVAAQLLAEKRALAVPALPALFAAWATDPDLDISEEIIAIAPADTVRSVPHLIRALSATNSLVRSYSAHLLGVFTTNSIHAAPALLAAFRTNTTDRSYFARAYFKITGECAELIPALREILRAEEIPYSREKQSVLGLLADAAEGGATALPEVLNLVHAKPASELNGVALLTLSRICDDQQLVLHSILEALNSTNRSLPDEPRFWAIPALGNLGSTSLPYLINLYTNSNDRYQAGRALKKLGLIAVPYLDVFRSELHSSDSYRSRLACEIIAGLGTNSSPAIPELRSLLMSDAVEVRPHAAAALIELGFREKEIVETLIDHYPAFNGWPGSGLETALLNLIINDERSRAIIQERLKNNPSAAKHLADQIESWRLMAKSWGMETFHLLLHAQALEEFLTSIGYQQQPDSAN